MTDAIKISRKLVDEVISHCKKDYPDEACGLLAGKTGSVENIYKITNIRHSAFNYEMDSMEQLKCEKAIRKAGLKIIGIYHSHPTSSAYPSQLDIMRVYWPGDPDMPIYPDACYVIVGLVGGETEVKAFKVNSRQKISEIKLNII
jgi:proteasome lid subunit RPN8/RPN11